MERRCSENAGKKRIGAYVDAHVHIHDCFELDEFLVAAVKNFQMHSVGDSDCPQPRFVLCLTESYGADYFSRLTSVLNKTKSGVGRWSFGSSGSDVSLLASHPQFGSLEIVAGRQIVTAERLEVLALGTTRTWEDGQTTGHVIASVTDAGAVSVLPWGFGKWLGRRRRVVESLINEFGGGSVYLGDNSGRSAVLPTPPEFALAEAKGMRVLPGSDPLPFESESNRAGSFGFQIDCLSVQDSAWKELCVMLTQGQGELRPFGKLESPFRFARNQIAMQYKTRIAGRKRAA
jgi:hypothetical protein